MNAVATSSASSNPFKRHRASSEESDEGSVKKPKYYYILEPETTDYSSDGSESIYSYQAKTTDTAKDTSDTSTKSEDSMYEFEVVSNCDDSVYPFPMRDSSSVPEDFRNDAFEIDEHLRFFNSDSSDVSSISSLLGNNKRLFLFKNCVQCGESNNTPFRYCDKCYKVKKNFFPPRPKGRKHLKHSGTKEASLADSANDDLKSCDSGISSMCKDLDQRIDCSEKDNIHRKELCGTCLINPKDGGYVHNNIIHVYSCYKCSVRTIKQIGRCPICNVRVRQVCRVITI